jgi:hypothetical protein
VVGEYFSISWWSWLVPFEEVKTMSPPSDWATLPLFAVSFQSRSVVLIRTGKVDWVPGTLVCEAQHQDQGDQKDSDLPDELASS